jgi:ubiquinone/menaquinone biosynthesis C-methylase UbiE
MTDGPGETYDRIAAHFSATREYAWPEVETFLDGRTGRRALDLGCGNGRHAELLAARVETVVGFDLSRGLLREARGRATERGFDAGLVQGDAAALPFRPDRFDLAVYVATLHHLRPRSGRLGSLDELARVLAPGGRALVSAWATVHDRFAAEHGDAEEGFDTHVDWTLPGGERVPRFYHIYAPAEFRADLDASALSVAETFVSSGNCYAVVGPASDAD